MSLVPHSTHTTESTRYEQGVSELVQNPAEDSLVINVSKTKELCCTGRVRHQSFFLNCKSFKYLSIELHKCHFPAREPNQQQGSPTSLPAEETISFPRQQKRFRFGLHVTY
ncbi:hypothetical protein ILYODFUR_020855 [Ilyodon furcidens]|uniref:Uncharacterized protein n=1 Tax=Ilyodon furcidens TaxID=33524 RepID=A0ABV0VI22_9TELE